MINIFKIHQNVLPMMIALARRTYANLTFVSVDHETNAVKELIHVKLDNANVAIMMNVHLQNIVLLGTAWVNSCKFQEKLYHIIHTHIKANFNHEILIHLARIKGIRIMCRNL